MRPFGGSVVSVSFALEAWCAISFIYASARKLRDYTPSGIISLLCLIFYFMVSGPTPIYAGSE